MNPYSGIRVHGLHPGDEKRRLKFVYICLKTSEDPRFFILLFGLANQNSADNDCWASENPCVKKELYHQEQLSFNVICLCMDNRVTYHVYEEILIGDKYLEIVL